MKLILRTLMLLAVVSAAGAVSAQSTDLYRADEYISQRGDTLRYRLLEPERLAPDESYPLVLFLHGAGERGRENESQLTHGAQMWLNPVNRERYPAFVVMPQCPPEGYWAYDSRPKFAPDSMPAGQAATPIVCTLRDFIAELTARPEIDASRVYVMGLSMGGMATYDVAVRYPELVAAAVPICGTVNPSRLKTAAGVPFRIYHGDADPVVPVEGSRRAYRALREAGADVTLIEFPGVGHGSWNPAFTDAGLLPWLFSQRKK